MNEHDHVEVELVYSQLINEVFDGRIPIATDSVVSLCALIAQAEVGDFNADCVNMNAIERASEKCNEAATDNDSKNLFDYRSTTRILPRELRDKIRLANIAECHKTFAGMKVIETRCASISLIKAWSLYGAAHFHVTVSPAPRSTSNLLGYRQR